MTNFSSTIGPGIQLGKENGLTLLLDAEVYDYAFSPQKGTILIRVSHFSYLSQNSIYFCILFILDVLSFEWFLLNFKISVSVSHIFEKN